MFVGGRPSRRERRERRSQTVGGSSVAVAGVGLRMLKDMGWQEGDELGRHGGSEDRRRRNGGGGGGGSGDHILSSRAGLGAVAASAGGRAACITLPSSSQVRRAKHSAGLGSAVAASAPSADKLWEQTNMGYKLMLQRVSMNCVRVERGEEIVASDHQVQQRKADIKRTLYQTYRRSAPRRTDSSALSASDMCGIFGDSGSGSSWPSAAAAAARGDSTANPVVSSGDSGDTDGDDAGMEGGGEDEDASASGSAGYARYGVGRFPPSAYSVTCAARKKRLQKMLGDVQRFIENSQDMSAYFEEKGVGGLPSTLPPPKSGAEVELVPVSALDAGAGDSDSGSGGSSSSGAEGGKRTDEREKLGGGQKSEGSQSSDTDDVSRKEKGMKVKEKKVKLDKKLKRRQKREKKERKKQDKQEDKKEDKRTKKKKKNKDMI